MSAFRMLLCTAHIRFYPKRTSRGPLLRPNLYVTGFNTKYDSDESNLMSQCDVVTDFREATVAKGRRGLDRRHRDRSGKIEKKHGNTRIGSLRREYGDKFARGPPQRHDAQDLTQRNRLHLVARVSEASP